jgi:hypothetical protein
MEALRESLLDVEQKLATETESGHIKSVEKDDLKEQLRQHQEEVARVRQDYSRLSFELAQLQKQEKANTTHHVKQNKNTDLIRCSWDAERKSLLAQLGQANVVSATTLS